MRLNYYFSYFLFTLLVSPTINPRVAVTSNGLTVELIHRDSPESPFYPGNLTVDQRIHRLVHQSDARVDHLMKMALASIYAEATNITQAIDLDDIIRPSIHEAHASLYMIRLGIGTFGTSPNSLKLYHLHVDTGSDLTWTQCEGCLSPGHRCFGQNVPPFPNSRSETYKILPCNHMLCKRNRCPEDPCGYSIRYTDGAYTSGILGSDTFTFPSATRSAVPLHNIIFGCSTDSANMACDEKVQQNAITGIMGLGRSPMSFVRQMESLSNGRFSYCLKGRPSSTHLRFGGDIVPPRNLQTTPLVQISGSVLYHLRLQGLSVNGFKLNINPAFFEPSLGHGKSGCIIDSGTPLTYIVKPAYTILENYLVDYFARYLTNMRRSRRYEGFLELCYLGKTGVYHNLPGMTFHFANANFEVKPEQVFLINVIGSGVEIVCLAMLPHNSRTLLGARLQENQKFIFDDWSNQLSFGPEDCSQNS